MSREVWFWLIVDGALMAWCIWEAYQLFALPEELNQFTSDIGTKEGENAADQDGP